MYWRDNMNRKKEAKMTTTEIEKNIKKINGSMA